MASGSARLPQGWGSHRGELLWTKSSGSSHLFSVRAVSRAITHLDKGLALSVTPQLCEHGDGTGLGDKLSPPCPAAAGAAVRWPSPHGAVPPGWPQRAAVLVPRCVPGTATPSPMGQHGDRAAVLGGAGRLWGAAAAGPLVEGLKATGEHELVLNRAQRRAAAAVWGPAAAPLPTAAGARGEARVVAAVTRVQLFGGRSHLVPTAPPRLGKGTGLPRSSVQSRDPSSGPQGHGGTRQAGREAVSPGKSPFRQSGPERQRVVYFGRRVRAALSQAGIQPLVSLHVSRCPSSPGTAGRTFHKAKGHTGRDVEPRCEDQAPADEEGEQVPLRPPLGWDAPPGGAGARLLLQGARGGAGCAVVGRGALARVAGGVAAGADAGGSAGPAVVARGAVGQAGAPVGVQGAAALCGGTAASAGLQGHQRQWHRPLLPRDSPSHAPRTSRLRHVSVATKCRVLMSSLVPWRCRVTLVSRPGDEEGQDSVLVAAAFPPSRVWDLASWWMWGWKLWGCVRRESCSPLCVLTLKKTQPCKKRGSGRALGGDEDEPTSC